MKVARAFFIALVISASSLIGFRMTLFPHDETIADLLAAWTVSLALAGWCLIDGQIRKQPVPISVSWMLVFFAPVAVPAYVFWSRGWWALLLLPVGFLVCALAAASGAAVALQIDGWAF